MWLVIIVVIPPFPERVKFYRVVPGEFNLSSPNFLLRQLWEHKSLPPSLVFCFISPPHPPPPFFPNSKLYMCFMAEACCCRWHVSLEESLVCRSLRRKVKFAGEVFTTLQCAQLPRFSCLRKSNSSLIYGGEWGQGGEYHKTYSSFIIKAGEAWSGQPSLCCIKKENNRHFWACPTPLVLSY